MSGRCRDKQRCPCSSSGCRLEAAHLCDGVRTAPAPPGRWRNASRRGLNSRSVDRPDQLHQRHLAISKHNAKQTHQHQQQHQHTPLARSTLPLSTAQCASFETVLTLTAQVCFKLARRSSFKAALSSRRGLEGSLPSEPRTSTGRGILVQRPKEAQTRPPTRPQPLQIGSFNPAIPSASSSLITSHVRDHTISGPANAIPWYYCTVASLTPPSSPLPRHHEPAPVSLPLHSRSYPVLIKSPTCLPRPRRLVCRLVPPRDRVHRAQPPPLRVGQQRLLRGSRHPSSRGEPDGL